MSKLHRVVSFCTLKLRAPTLREAIVDVSPGFFGSIGATLFATNVSFFEAVAVASSVGAMFCAARTGVAFVFRWLNYRRSTPTHLVPPGSYLIICSEFLFTMKFMRAVCQPVIADMREEYFEALSQNRVWKARWVRVRGTWSFFSAIGLDRAFAFVSFFVKAWKSVN